jgi:hypothetical protein
MKHYFSRAALIALVILASAERIAAQNLPPQKPLIPLKVQVIISRYEGDKKISSMPYTLSVTTNSDRVNLSMGSQIPVPNWTQPTQPNQAPMQNYSFLSVGTTIGCTVLTTDDGRFRVEMSVEDTSVQEKAPSIPVPTLRNFSMQNAMTLRDGQTAQFTSAADKMTGEVVRVDVTLTVEK